MVVAMKSMKAKKTMKAAMKAMKSMKKAMKSMGKGAIAEAAIGDSGLKRSQVMKILNALGEVGAKEVKSSGKFVVPGVCMIKTRLKKATKAGKKMLFGKEVKVKAKPAKTVVKAFAVKAIKNQF
eukprot:TRINITY_DN721_c1_g1_i1.p1 TRINITY_DN721_c1_g1~~TRINITY_DN721_c1_g1_i1.p1  ORF type:complete len:124 (-),score=45.44 TRINITY_DN721_c1_g1_i1:369-740(-)